VQDREQHDRDWLIEVQSGGRGGQNRVGVPQVGLNVAGGAFRTRCWVSSAWAWLMTIGSWST